MMGIGPPEVILIAIVGLIVLGPRKLPGIARSIGKAIRDFHKAMNSFDLDGEPEKEALPEPTEGPDETKDQGAES